MLQKCGQVQFKQFLCIIIMEALPNDCLEIIVGHLEIPEIQNLDKVNKYFHNYLIRYRNSFSNYPILNWGNINDYTKHNLAKHNYTNISMNNLYTIKELCKNEKSMYNIVCEEIGRKFHIQRTFVHGLTDEQKFIKNFSYVPRQMYAIQAFAGTGKTTTLVEIAKSNQDKKILYIAFNKALAIEASEKAFVNLNVDIYTIHSLTLQHTEKYEVQNLTNAKISEFLNISYEDACLTRRVLECYLASPDKIITVNHLGNLGNIFFDFANELWESMKLRNYPMCHDGYVKLFMLSKKNLGYDMILVDEAQDISYCMFRCIKNQRQAIKIFVGDIHQQIYGFRNVCNVISEVDESRRFGLHQSFRFGFDLTYLVNNFLREFKRETNSLKACNKNTKIVNRFDNTETYVVVCRSNYTVRKLAIEYSNRGVQFSVLGKSINPDKEIYKLDSLHHLATFGESNHRKLQGLGSLEEAYYHFRELHNEKWKMRIRLYNEFDYEYLKDGWEKIKLHYNETDYKVILTTVHQSKGLEFDCVKLADDYIQYINPEHIVRTAQMLENYNLIYVAITRAKKKLWLNKTLIEYFTYIKKCSEFPRMISKTFNRCDNCAESENVYLIDEIQEYKGLYNPVNKCIHCMNDNLANLLN